MSLANNEIKLTKTLDKRINLDKELVYNITKGPSTINFKSEISTNFDNNMVSFSNTYPNASFLLDRQLWIEIPFEIILEAENIKDPNDNEPLVSLGNGFDAPRAYPISSITDNVKVTLGNSIFNTNISEYIHAYAWFFNENNRKYLSGTPHFLDNYNNYQDSKNDMNNPLGGYQNSGFDEKRGAHFISVQNVNIPDGDDFRKKATINFVVREPIFLSPLIYDKFEKKGFANISNFELQLSFSNLPLIWSHRDNVNGTNKLRDAATKVKIKDSPKLLLSFLGKNLISGDRIPPIIPYDRVQFQRFITSGTPLVPGQKKTLNSKNFQLNSIPNSIIIFLKERRQDMKMTKPDVFARITNISISFNNSNNQLNGTNEYQMYNISRRNGLNMTFNQYYYYVGSVIRLDFSKDLSLPSNLASGVLGNFQLQMDVDYENISGILGNGRQIQYDLNIITEETGIVELSNNNTTSSIGIVSQEDVLRTEESEFAEIFENNLEMQNEIGGSLKSTLGDVSRFLTKKIPKLVNDNKETIQNVGKVAIPAISSLLGLGFTKDEAEQIIKDKKAGSMLIGGAKLNTNQKRKLKNRI